MKTKKTIVPVLLYFSVFLSCTSADGYLKKASNAIDRGRYREAIQYLDKALAKEKYLTEAYSEKAYCYTELKNDDSALIVLNELINFHPQNTLAFYNAGLCKYRQKKWDDALVYFNRALKTKGYNPEDTTGNTFIFEYSDAAKEILGKSDRFEVPYGDLFYMSGLTNYSAGKRKAAYYNFMDCISRKAFMGESYYMIGVIWSDVNQKSKACEAFTNATLHGDTTAKNLLVSYCK